MNREILKDFSTRSTLLDTLKDELKSKKETFEKSIETLKTQITNVSTELDTLKNTIINEAENDFKKTGKKKLDGGIGIREGVKYTYDNSKAFAWAKETGLCLSLDTKAFEKIITVQKLNFITEEKELKVTFPAKILLED